MIADSGNWSIGSIVGIIVLILMALILLISLIGAVALTEPFLLLPAGVAATIAGILLAVLFPYSGEYHQWREVTGTVERVEGRLLEGGSGGMSEMFVVRYEDTGAEFRVDDSRGALVQEGDTLTIRCLKEWDYQGTDGYKCRWGSLAAA